MLRIRPVVMSVKTPWGCGLNSIVSMQQSVIPHARKGIRGDNTKIVRVAVHKWQRKRPDL